MGDKCNCYRFSPRDSLSGAVAQIADYLSKHPGWNETELRTFVDGLISSSCVETFNGRSGNVTLNKDDVNNLLIANCYFAEADESIESIDVLALYKLGIRIVFTQYSSEVDGYTLAYGIEYYPTTDSAKAYLFSSGSGGVGAVVSVNGKTGTVVINAGDILMNNGVSVESAVSSANALANAAYSPDKQPPYPVNSVNSKTGSVMLKVVDVSNGDSVDDNAYIFIDETENYPDIIAPDSNKLGGQIPSYYATAESVNSLKSDKANKADVLSLEEIQASTDLDGRIASASALKETYKRSVYESTVYGTFDASSKTITYNFSTLKNTHGLFVFIFDHSNNGRCVLAILSSWSTLELGRITQNESGNLSISGYIETGSFSVSFTSNKFPASMSGRCVVRGIF